MPNFSSTYSDKNDEMMQALKEISDKKRFQMIERLAEIDHAQWVFWTQEIVKEIDGLTESLLDLLGVLKHMRQRGVHIPDTAYELIELAQTRLAATKRRLSRWETLWCAYAKLSEEMKEHDRVWARKAYEVMKGEV